MIVQPVTVLAEIAHWVTLTLYKGTILVLPRTEFIEGLKRGKAWRRAAAMKARLDAQATSQSTLSRVDHERPNHHAH